MNVRSILQSVIFGFAAALLLASCQTGPSIVKEKSDVFIKDGVDIPADLTGENSKLKRTSSYWMHALRLWRQSLRFVRRKLWTGMISPAGFHPVPIHWKGICIFMLVG